MTIFWVLIILMTLLAMGILVWPLLQYTPQLTIGRQKIIPVAILVLALPVLASSIYLKLGASQQVAEHRQVIQQNKVIQAEIQKLGSLQNIILALKQKVTVDPDAKGFALLGRLYLKTQQFNEASAAFAKANQLNPEQPDILVGYAESIYFSNHATLTMPAKQLLDQTLKLQPDQPDAINLLAMDAYQRGHYTVAINYWERLLPQFAQGSEGQGKLLQMIAMAQKQAESAPNKTSAAAIRRIKSWS